jgi:hypothetical protein
LRLKRWNGRIIDASVLLYHGRSSRSEFQEGQVPLKASGSCSWCWYSWRHIQRVYLAQNTMFALLIDLEDYATTYRATRDACLKAANELKLATGPYKAARDAYVAATATYTKSLYE